MESHFNPDQNLVIGFLRTLRLQILPNTSPLTAGYDKLRDAGHVPFNIIHFTLFYYYRRINFFMLSSGSSEAQNPKYNQFKLIAVPNLLELDNNLKYDDVQYVLKLHSWKKNLSSLTAKMNQAGPKSKKKKSIKATGTAMVTTTSNGGSGGGAKKKKTPSRVSMKVGGVKLGLPGGKKKETTSLLPSKAKKLKGKNAHKPARSVGNIDLSSVLEDDEDDEELSSSKKKKKGGRSPVKGHKKQKHTRMVKSMAVLPDIMDTSKINTDVEFDKYGFGTECISMFELPKWGWLQKKREESGNGLRYGHYHLFFRCGGLKAEFDDRTDEIDMILFNTANCNYNGLEKQRDIVIDAYYQKLPSFRNSLEEPFMTFNRKRSTLYAFGGYHDGKALTTINCCKMNVKSVSALKWIRNRNKQQMLQGRYKTNACYIGGDKYLILGGTNKKAKSEKSCELYDNHDKCEDEFCMGVADMHFKRSKLTSCFIGDKQKVIVGGGMIYGKGSTQIEIYDIKKNKWILNKAEFNFEHKYPLIWMDFHNPNVCYVAGDWIGFGGRKDSLGYIEWLDLREKQKKWNMFTDNTLTDMFKIQGVRANLWESRTLTML
eukprot:CAMPEP_0197037280 /NCGR_PEP_ID=MMETSP1384-20130603/14531_1 /TAXON_ID=29189 /ORGANISM="Ammonia sp." /LENGTH=598 /DNA_ID=CAMNT_0042467561 /DNA_START=90 /DNA_END=1886 /DNA_ORIENTATION=-